MAEARRKIESYNAAKATGEPGIIPEIRRLTNLGTFRFYVLNYLKANPRVSQEMTVLARQLEPGPKGVPIEIYCFSSDTAWANYEGLQADLFDHLIAILPEFGAEGVPGTQRVGLRGGNRGSRVTCARVALPFILGMTGMGTAGQPGTRRGPRRRTTEKIENMVNTVELLGDLQRLREQGYLSDALLRHAVRGLSGTDNFDWVGVYLLGEEGDELWLHNYIGASTEAREDSRGHGCVRHRGGDRQEPERARRGRGRQLPLVQPQREVGTRGPDPGGQGDLRADRYIDSRTPAAFSDDVELAVQMIADKLAEQFVHERR